jgi:hypothetical protein
MKTFMSSQKGNSVQQQDMKLYATVLLEGAGAHGRTSAQN